MSSRFHIFHGFQHMQRLPRQLLICCAIYAFICFAVPSVSAKYFPLSGQNTWLQEVTGDVAVQFRALRYNRAIAAWNLDLALVNQTGRNWVGSWVVLIKNHTGTSGAIKPDGVLTNDMNRGFYEVTTRLPNRTLAVGQIIPIRTIALGYLAGQTPQLEIQVFVTPQADWQPSLALVWTLNETGLPLPDVQVEEQGPMGSRKYSSDSAMGVVTLGQDTGEHFWKFSRSGYLPVWRSQTLQSGFANWIPHPRLALRNTNSAAAAGSIKIGAGSGGASGSTSLIATPLTGQTLPAMLPPGWSPLHAFWLETGGKMNSANALFAVPVSAELRIWDTLAVSETAYLARWDEEQLQWRAAGRVAGSGTNRVAILLSQAGAYALVVGDPAPNAPSQPSPGQLLEGSVKTALDWNRIAAAGRVDPEINRASRIGELVTAKATLVLSNSVTMPSGAALRGLVREAYQLNGGGRRTPPQYEVSLFAYHRPGATEPSNLCSELPLRPLLLLGEEELSEATVSMDVLPPGAFAGGVLGTNESIYRQGDLTLTAKAGDLMTPQALSLRMLDTGLFQELAPTGTVLAAGFELTIGGVVSGRSLQLSWNPAKPVEGYYILARIALSEGFYGLTPVERFQISTNGWTSLEPMTGIRLPGITGAGQYLLVRVAGPQALVQGVARYAAQSAAAGMLIHVEGQPWQAISASDGRYQITAPQGGAQVQVRDPATGFFGSAAVQVQNVQLTYTVDVAAIPSGPRVTSISPASGAYNVPRVASIVISFSEPLNPGSIGTNGIVLLTTNQQPVTASLSLNLRNTTVSLLPKTQLAANTLYTVQINTNLTSQNGLKLQGPNAFSFTTERAELDRSTARVISYEPTNGLARLVGSAGIADPESAVILINETSGRTATILSKVDGSFDNFIEASVDDFLSAMVVNANGTRTMIPVTRQIFRDGSVGLFQAGGILEAQSDGGPVQIIVEPGAIETKTKFNLQALSMTELLTILGGVQPQDGGKVLSGFKIKMEGDPLKTAAGVKMPLNPSTVQPPQGKTLEDGAYVLATPREIDGVKVFEYIDDMSYRSGFLESVSATDAATNKTVKPTAFLKGSLDQPTQSYGALTSEGTIRAAGLPATGNGPQGGDTHLFMSIAMSFAGRMQVQGQFLSWDASHSNERPVPGGTVFINQESHGGIQDGKMPAGALVTTANNYGSFKLSTWAHNDAFYLFGMTLLFPGKIGKGVANPTVLGAGMMDPIVKGVIHIERGGASNQPDYVPPQVFVTCNPARPLAGEDIQMQVLATDNRGMSRIQVILQQGNCSFITDGNPITEGQSMRRFYKAKASASQRLMFRILADDSSANRTELFYSLDVLKVRIPPPNPNDVTGPAVVATTPAEGDQYVDRFSRIQINFSEPIDTSITNDMSTIDSSVRITPSAGEPRINFSANQRTMYVQYLQMTGNTDYTVTIGNGIHDLNNNSLDQVVNGVHALSYSFHFKTWNDLAQALPSIKDGAGVVGKGPYLFALDKISTKESALRIYKKSGVAPDLIMTVGNLPEYAKCLEFIPAFSYYDAQLQKHTKDFVAASGGLVGTDTSRQWLWLIDVTDPSNPDIEVQTHIIRSPTASVVKLMWSAPVLGYLQYDSTTIDGIGLIDLQLLLYSHGLSNYQNEPMDGQVGIDSNGDGDYTDDLETIPRPMKRMIRDGVFNGGLVGGYSLGENCFAHIWDFEIAFGGRFAAVVHGADPASGSIVKAGYRTVAVNGEQLPVTQGFYEQFSIVPYRILLMFGITVGTDNPRILNLAMISELGSLTITVLNITDPKNPVQLSKFVVPTSIGEPKTAAYLPAQKDVPARIALSGTQAVLLLDPAYLDWSSNAGADHPAFLGVIPGVGSLTRNFYFGSTNMFAVNEGGKALLDVIAPGPIEVVGIDAIDYNSNNTVRRASDNKLDIVIKSFQSQDVLFLAKMFPTNASPRPQFPHWIFDGEDPQTGRNVQYNVPSYSGRRPVYLGGITPNTHIAQCEQGTFTLRVYPEEKDELRLTDNVLQGLSFLTDILDAFNAGLSAVQFGLSGTIEMISPKGKINLSNQWKEVSGTNIVGYAYDIQAMADPLAGIRARIRYGFAPPRALADLVHAYVYLGFEVKMILRGTLSRNERGQLSGSLLSNSETPVQVGFDAKAGKIAEIALTAESKIVGNDRLFLRTDPAPAAFVVRSGLDFTGVRGKISVKILNGIIEFQHEMTVIDGSPILRDKDFVIYEMSP